MQYKRRLADSSDLLPHCVRRIVSGVKAITVRQLNRQTAKVMDAVEGGDTIELRRNGKTVAYISSTPPESLRKPDWKAHFQWLRMTATKEDAVLLSEFEQERRRSRKRESEMSSGR